MADEQIAPTAEQVAAYATDKIAQIADPEGYVREKQRLAAVSEYEALAAIVGTDTATVEKLAQIRDAALAALEPVAPVAPPARLTVTDMGAPVTTATTKATWSATQQVEPLRDGQPWCTWEDAEEMLVRAALAQMRGTAAAKGVRLKRDDKAMTLTIELV